jgi:MFS transporter, MCT family, solute carrier family 16 (monocarboxylic acid transporters), member 10
MFSGVFTGLLAAPLASLGKSNEVGERVGLMFTIVGFGAMGGPPISGAIRGASEGWGIVGIYAGK